MQAGRTLVFPLTFESLFPERLTAPDHNPFTGARQAGSARALTVGQAF